MNGLIRHAGITVVLVIALSLVAVSFNGCAKTQNAVTAAAAAEVNEVPEVTSPAENIPIEVVSISDAHPGDDITVTIKTKPGAEVKILFTSPSGNKSAYPQDNTKVAGPDGIITWQWNISTHVPSGEATLTLTPTGATPDSVLTVKKNI